jgi:hypothetical protein
MEQEWCKRNACRLLAGKQQGKRPLERLMCRWVDIMMDVAKIAWSDMDWIGLTQDAISSEHGNEPLDSTKCSEILE